MERAELEAWVDEAFERSDLLAHAALAKILDMVRSEQENE